jgi:hypothetical protein
MAHRHQEILWERLTIVWSETNTWRRPDSDSKKIAAFRDARNGSTTSKQEPSCQQAVAR